MTFLLPLLLCKSAFATSGFDATTPAAMFNGVETFTQDASIRLWSEIERIEDPDRTLFSMESYNTASEWPDESEWAPWIGTCFGTARPGSWSALLHIGMGESYATGTPILFVPGAGDNGSRGFITMATHMNNEGRPVYALTFAHRHGDTFQQAEIVADAIARIKARTGASQVDVVAHSKGGPTVALYLSNEAGSDWGNLAYEAVGTAYRGDVRRVVFIASPLAGIDSGYRWPLGVTASLEADEAYSPSPWRTYYPYAPLNYLIEEDLSEQDFLSADGDLFPGQRQILARQSYDLPGSMSWLGAYSIQPDWYTTYEGGQGYVSYSDGIDAAIEDGGNFIQRLADTGVDPSVEVFILAGKNPIMASGLESYLALMFGQAWVDEMTDDTDAWAQLFARLAGESLVDVGVTEAEIQGLAQGKLILGEITGPSDGLVFVSSATDESALTARGAVVQETKVVNLSHLDLLYASPITGGLLKEAAAADPQEYGWADAIGDRYISEDTIGWVEEKLADPEVPDTGGDDDTGDSGIDDSGTTDSEAGDSGGADDSGVVDTGGSDLKPCAGAEQDAKGSGLGCGCASGSDAGGVLGGLLGIGVLVRRRRQFERCAT